jgi:hypothetical protein
LTKRQRISFRCKEINWYNILQSKGLSGFTGAATITEAQTATVATDKPKKKKLKKE